MSDEQKIVLTKRQLDAMSSEELTNLLLKAITWQATCVVRDRHGNIKYDDPSKAGSYGEEHLIGEKSDG